VAEARGVHSPETQLTKGLRATGGRPPWNRITADDCHTMADGPELGVSKIDGADNATQKGRTHNKKKPGPSRGGLQDGAGLSRRGPLLRLDLVTDRREPLRKSVGHAVSQRLQKPMQSSVRGDEAIWDALQPSQGDHLKESRRQARRTGATDAGVVDLERKGTCPAW